MTRANANQWFTDAKAANSIVPIARFVSPTVFATEGRWLRLPLLAHRRGRGRADRPGA